MLGSEIAKNLKANKNKWSRYVYYKDGEYCVIGLKLHEMGIPVEKWEHQGQTIVVLAPNRDWELSKAELDSLGTLQALNDRSPNVESLINILEATYKAVDFPLEKLAEEVKKDPRWT